MPRQRASPTCQPNPIVSSAISYYAVERMCADLAQPILTLALLTLALLTLAPLTMALWHYLLWHYLLWHHPPRHPSPRHPSPRHPSPRHHPPRHHPPRQGGWYPVRHPGEAQPPGSDFNWGCGEPWYNASHGASAGAELAMVPQLEPTSWLTGDHNKCMATIQCMAICYGCQIRQVVAEERPPSQSPTCRMRLSRWAHA